MNTLRIRDDYVEQAAKMKGKFPDRSNADRVIDSDTMVLAADGSAKAILLRKAIPIGLHLRAYELLKDVKGLVSNRATALGTKSLPRSINRDGIPSPQHGVNTLVLEATPARQGILGWSQPGLRTTLTEKYPEMLDGNRELIEIADRLYSAHLPALHATQRVAAQAHGRLWHTAFTNLYAAKQFQTAYHRDGNLNGAMTAIMPLGRFTGGELILLRWRLLIPYQPGDLLLCDAEDLHGNLPIEGERVSAVLYCSGRKRAV